MKPAELLFLIFCMLLIALNAKAQQFDIVYETANVISDLVQDSPNGKIAKNAKYRLEFATDIVESAHKYEVPEFLLTVKIYNESSFKMSVWDGARQSFGLGQMHGVATKGCELKTRRGQLECSARWLRVCFDKCGHDWSKALSAYGTSGHCDWRKAKYPKKYRNSIKRQIKLWMDFEAQRQSVRDEIISDLEFYSDFR